MYIVRVHGYGASLIYLGIFKFKKHAMELYNYAKEEINGYAFQNNGYTHENTNNINKSSTSFRICYICEINGHPEICLKIEYWTEKFFNNIKNEMYLYPINGKEISLHEYEEMEWRKYYPKLFANFSYRNLPEFI